MSLSKQNQYAATSASSPIIASVYGLAAHSATQTAAKQIWHDAGRHLFDVKSGNNNGTCLPTLLSMCTAGRLRRTNGVRNAKGTRRLLTGDPLTSRQSGSLQEQLVPMQALQQFVMSHVGGEDERWPARLKILDRHVFG